MRDWALRFNARGPEGVIDRKALGKVPKLNAAQRQALVQTVESGPIPAIHGTAPNISALTAITASSDLNGYVVAALLDCDAIGSSLNCH